MTTSRLRAALSISLLLTTTLAGARIASGQDAGIAPCDIAAWSIDKDPNGLNVRAGPHAYSPVIASIPPAVKVGGDEFAAEVSITGSKDRWFRIDRAVFENYATDHPTKILFEGEGWISGSLIALSVEGQFLRSTPSHDAPPVVDFFKAFETKETEAGPDYFNLEHVIACTGYWVEVEGTYRNQRFRGWTDDTCSNQVTTCS
jgi:hypothetical protein